ncbi:MAG: 30S ribosomal protein S1 [Clostridia bacterium]|nr:30S ribosomal protein S1 [Clostridia bacterium]
MNEYLPEGTLCDTKENRAALASAETLRAAMRAGRILEAPVLSADSALTAELALGEGAVGVMPVGESVLLQPGEKFKEIAVIGRVGKPAVFRVLGELSPAGGKARFLVSRRAAQLACKEAYLDRLRPGDVIDCAATHLEQYGAFCDVGCGCFALLPVDCLSVSRIPHPSERLAVGETVRAALKYRDRFGRLFLTRRELCGTWEENAAFFSVGQTVTGTVRSAEPYGIFVELAPNLAGLAEPTEGIRPGDAVSVYIKSMLPEKMKIKLVIIGTCRREAVRASAPRFPIEDEAHIERWIYSPPGCARRIGTVFNGDPDAAV